MVQKYYKHVDDYFIYKNLRRTAWLWCLASAWTQSLGTARWPFHDYELPVDALSKFHLQNISDVTVDPDISKYNFLTRRVELRYSDANDLKEEHYHIIESQATPKRVIKSNRSGKVSLSVNWKNCGAWVRFL